MPELVIVINTGDNSKLAGIDGLIWMGQPGSTDADKGGLKFTISGRTLSWYTERYYGSSSIYASYKAQCNSKDAQYNFIAFA